MTFVAFFTLVLLFVSVSFGLTPAELRAALVTAGFTRLGNFTCVPTNIFATGSHYECRNGNIVSVSLTLATGVTSFQLPDIDCEGLGSSAGPNVNNLPPVFFRLNSNLTSLTIGNVRNCPEVFVGDNERLQTLTLGTLHNVSELTIDTNKMLSGSISVNAPGLAGLPYNLLVSLNGNATNPFNLTHTSNASLALVQVLANNGLAALSVTSPMINRTFVTENGLLQQVEFPNVALTNELRIYTNPKLSSISLPALRVVDDRAGKALGLFQIKGNPGLTQLSAPVLESAASGDLTNNSALPWISLPALTTGRWNIGSIFSSPNKNLASVSLPNSWNASITISGNPKLIDVNVSAPTADFMEISDNYALTRLTILPAVAAVINATAPLLGDLRVKNLPALASLTVPDLRIAYVTIENCSTLAAINFTGTTARFAAGSFRVRTNKALTTIDWPAIGQFTDVDVTNNGFVGPVPSSLPVVAGRCVLQQSPDSNCFDCYSTKSNCTCVQCNRFTTARTPSTTRPPTTTSGKSTTGTTTLTAVVGSGSTNADTGSGSGSSSVAGSGDSTAVAATTASAAGSVAQDVGHAAKPSVSLAVTFGLILGCLN